MGKSCATGQQLLKTVCLTVGTWWRRSRTRIALREVDSRLVADIDRTEVERQRECAKWFWQR
jgi:uncharacterized protein YjiS (DUF1127 family)